MTPGSAAALPAPAMMTRTPRSAAVEAYSATPRGSRCAESTFISNVMARSSSSSAAACMTSLSDSEPIRIPTWGPSVSSSAQRYLTSGAETGSGMHVLRALGPQGDVGAMHASLQVDQIDGCVRTGAGLCEVAASCRDAEHAAARGDELAVGLRRAGVKDGEGFERLRGGDPRDGASRCRGLWISRCGDNHGDAGVLCGRSRGARQGPGRRAAQEVQEVGVEARQDRLRFGVSEPDVELDDARAVDRQ